MSDWGSRTITCPLCGNRFEPAALACHSACPLGARCNLACCPNCGYEMPDASRSRLGRRLRPRPRSARSPDGVPLTHVGTGVDVRVRSLAAMPPGRRARLEAFGIAPGGAVRLVQRRPVPVVRVGETDLAVGAEILEEILVEP
jgi:Fe2+ transport system protein FeoA